MSGAEEVGADNTLLGGGLHATASQKTCSALLSAGALQHKHTVSPKNSGTRFANNNGPTVSPNGMASIFTTCCQPFARRPQCCPAPQAWCLLTLSLAPTSSMLIVLVLVASIA
jgi:hypothetical protein